MVSGDGLIVRVRCRTGRISAADLVALTEIAQRHGSGLIDLTRRANIQLRGIAPQSIPYLWNDLAELGLLDDNAEAEAVRNVMVSPLAGIDSTEAFDLRPAARDLELRLSNDRSLWQLSTKFGFIVDCAGLLSLDEERGDIRLKALRDGGWVKVAVGVDRFGGTAWLGLASPEVAAAAATRTAQVFLALRQATRSRMRDLSNAAQDAMQTALAPHLEPIALAPGSRGAGRRLGKIAATDRIIAVGLAAPFGRLEAVTTRALVTAALRLGVDEFRLSPWRSLYAAVSDEQTADAIVKASVRAGLIVDVAHPLLVIDACPGAQGCHSTKLNTRFAARQLAPILGQLNCRSLHVSGCAKGCARSKPADLVLVGTEDCFGVMRDATAQDEPHLFIRPERVAELAQTLKPA
jgi:precorrin-3B synthase